MKVVFLLVAVPALVLAAAVSDLELSLRQHVTYLADDAREGRGIGTAGLDSAAAYIAAQFQAAGLEPAFDGSYFQPFEMGWGVTLGPNNRVTLRDVSLDTSKGIMPQGFSAIGTVRGPVLFAGYGITAPEYNYDDFAGVEAAGHVLLCLTGEPGEFDTSSVFEGVNYTTHSGQRAKAGNAKLHEAVALLLVEGPIYADKGPEVLRPPRQDEPYSDCGIPVVRLTRAAVAELFPEFDLEALQRFIDNNTSPRSVPLKGDTIEIVVDLTRRSVPVKNVGAVIRGDSTLIVIGAHYDHLGYGQNGSLEPKHGLIHNGADDNASGVAAIIEAARMLKENRVRSTVLAVAFTGEEVGLAGSGHLVKHFPWEISRVRAMLNLDMVGRMKENKLTVVGCKTAEQFPQIVEQGNAGVGIEVTCKGDGYGPSDHMNFYTAGVPVLYLMTGAHEDYHKSTDDADKINYADLARVAQFTAGVVRAVDGYGQALTYVKVSEPPQKSSGRFRSSFGSIPDFSQPDSVKGVLLSGVRDSSAAAIAGLDRGDLLTRMGKVTINNLYDLVYALQIYAPGDTVEVGFVRAGEQKTTKAVLQPSSR